MHQALVPAIILEEDTHCCQVNNLDSFTVVALFFDIRLLSACTICEKLVRENFFKEDDA